MQLPMKRYFKHHALFVITAALLFQCSSIPIMPDLKDILEGEPPITTSLKDATTGVPFLDDFDPKVLAPMNLLPRSSDGGFTFEHSGLYVFDAESYCLKAGTYAPGGGDGYLYAPMKGPQAKIVKNILQRSYNHPEIVQRDIQVLLWAIITRTKISDMPREMQLTASKLLESEELFEINGGALSLIPEKLFHKIFDKLPPQVRKVLEAEARLRRILTKGRANYQEIERLAVLRGDAPSVEGDRDIILGRWSYNPKGFFIRYFPRSYSQTRVEVYIPELLQIDLDALGRIASISDGNGNSIETVYDDAIEPLLIPGETSLKAYAFRSIRFETANPDNPEEKLHNEWTHTGWTFCGVPAGGGNIETASQRFGSLVERYTWAKRYKTQLEKLDQQFNPEGTIDNILRLMHYKMALKQLAGKNHPEGADWVAEHINMVSKAWQYAVCKREGGCNGEGISLGPLFAKDGISRQRPVIYAAKSTNAMQRFIDRADFGRDLDGPIRYDPSGSDAIPGKTSRQRIGVSPRTTVKTIPKPDWLAPDSWNRLNECQKRCVNLCEKYRPKKNDPNPDDTIWRRCIDRCYDQCGQPVG